MRAGADGGRKKGRKKVRRSAEIKFCRDSLLWGEGGCPCGEVLVRDGAVGGRRKKVWRSAEMQNSLLENVHQVHKVGWGDRGGLDNASAPVKESQIEKCDFSTSSI